MKNIKKLFRMIESEVLPSTMFNMKMILPEAKKELSAIEIERGSSPVHNQFCQPGEAGSKGGTLFAGVVIARKKPVEIEAIQFIGTNLPEMERFVPVGKYCDDGTFEIVTLEGNLHVSIGDYVIKGVQDEFYPCKPNIFEQTYDILGEANKVG